jgi:PTH1 family peptidyl-tRNA hydrolase
VRLLVGLGNPGPRYERTRHNLGFRAAQEAARALGASLDQTRWNAVLGQGRAAGEPVAVLLPQTFMNVSGESVQQAARFWKVDPGTIVVIHDDLDLEAGRVQVKVGGGDGGHNGLKSLRQHLGTPDFVRIRVGIGRPPQGWDPSDYVLGKFTQDEEAQLEPVIETAAQAAVDAVTKGPLAAMNRWNKRPKPPKAKGEQDEKKEEAGTKDEASTKEK